MKNNCDFVSFVELHRLSGRATPDNLMIYKHALLLHKIYNTTDHNFERQAFNFFTNLNVPPNTLQNTPWQQHKSRNKCPCKQTFRAEWEDPNFMA